MARGIIVSFLGMFVMACSGCGGSGGSSSTQATTSEQGVSGTQIGVTTPVQYADSRPSTSYRLPVTDYGVVLPHGTAPGGVDSLGARDVFVYQAGDTYYMTYDGATNGVPWNTVMATSANLTAWTVRGNILPLGAAGSYDSNCVCYGVTFFDGTNYSFTYTTSNNGPLSPPVPYPDYFAMRATAPTPLGPWTKQPGLVFDPAQAGGHSAGPGGIIQWNGQYLQFTSTSQKDASGKWERGVRIARATSPDGPWTVDSGYAIPGTEQLENAVVWYQASTKTYFLFVNHVGDINSAEYDDADWVYWTQDPTQWNTAHKAVVMDGQASTWSKNVIGIPSVLQVGNRLALFYDGDKSPTLRTGVEGNLNRDIGMAWINLPITTPAQ